MGRIRESWVLVPVAEKGFMEACQWDAFGEVLVFSWCHILARSYRCGCLTLSLPLQPTFLFSPILHPPTPTSFLLVFLACWGDRWRCVASPYLPPSLRFLPGPTWTQTQTLTHIQTCSGQLLQTSKISFVASTAAEVMGMNEGIFRVLMK